MKYFLNFESLLEFLSHRQRDRVEVLGFGGGGRRVFEFSNQDLILKQNFYYSHTLKETIFTYR